MPHGCRLGVVLTGVLVFAFAGGLAAEFQVNTYTTFDQRHASVAAAAEGGFVVVWQSVHSRSFGALDTQFDVLGRRFAANGAPLGGAFRVRSETFYSNEAPAIASDAAGNFVVVWRHGSVEQGQKIHARRFAADGHPLGEVFQVSAGGDYRMDPDVASDAAGNFVVVWGARWPQWDAPGVGIRGRRFDAAGAPVGGEFAVTSSTSAGAPNVAMGESGAFLVTWKRGEVYRSLYDALLGRVYDASGDGAPEFAIAESTTIGYRSDVITAGGAFQVAWSESDVVSARHIHADGTMNAAVSLNVLPGSFPVMTAAPDGGFIAAWTGADGSGGGAFGRRFDAAGTARGPEFRLNSHTTSHQFLPSLAATAGGDFLAAWVSGLSHYSPSAEPRQDGSGTGIFGQSFADALFGDGFDSGDLGAWSATATDGGDLRAVPRLDGEGHAYALQAVVDDPAPLYVQDDSPDDEGHYRASFEFDPRGFDPGEASGAHRIRVFLGLESEPTRRAFALVLRRLGGAYALRARVRLEDGSRADTPFVPIAAGRQRLELWWGRATRPDSNDGFFALWVDDALVARLDALDNPSAGIESVRLGALSAKSGASGTLIWDSFVSRRWSAIGPGTN